MAIGMASSLPGYRAREEITISIGVSPLFLSSPLIHTGVDTQMRRAFFVMPAKAGIH